MFPHRNKHAVYTRGEEFNGIGLSKSAFNAITRLDLNWHPYAMKIRHKIQEGDQARRVNFSRWFLDKVQNENGFIEKIVIGDEAAFHLNGKVNSHNIVRYSPKGQMPDFHYDVTNSREKVTVWAGLCGNGRILGPVFFDGNVNGQAYVDMLNDIVIDEMDQIFNGHPVHPT